MNHHPAVNMWLTGDLHNLMRGLALTAQAIPPGAYRDGYQAALTVVTAALGVDVAPVPVTAHHHVDAPVAVDVVSRQRRDDPEPRRGPIDVNVFDGLSHESVPFAFSAFANMGGAR